MNQKRRDFLRTSAKTLLVVPVVAGFGRVAVAADMPKLEESDATAVALGYKHDASTVDASTYPKYEEGQKCSNCVLIQGEEGAEWRPCPIFPGKLVSAEGWCNSWTPKA